MLSKNLSAAIKEAEKEMPAGGSAAWEDGEYPVVVVAANVNTQFGAPRVGLQLQRDVDSSRRWFDLMFDEENPKSLAMTGRKLAALGLNDTLDSLSTQYPEDADAQLQGLAAALPGIKFVAGIQKVEKRNKPGEFMNFFDVKSLIDGPSAAPAAAPASGLSGLGGLMG